MCVFCKIASGEIPSNKLYEDDKAVSYTHLYISRRGAVNPIFAQYCNGTTVTCGGLSQWGTVALANNGYTPLGILRYYYGDDIVIDTATVQRRITSSYPGSPLTVGSRGEDVRTIRTWLNRIRRNYPAIPAISTTGGDTYNAEMQRSVQAFQRIFNLTPDGIVGPATWNKIAYIYVAVMRLAELGGEDIPLPAERPSGTPVSYTHLDVYKRQSQRCKLHGSSLLSLVWWVQDPGSGAPQTGFPRKFKNQLTAGALQASRKRFQFLRADQPGQHARQGVGTQPLW